MKLSNEALLEVMAIVQDGLLGEKDASVGLRELDLVVNEDYKDQLALSPEYVSTHPRSGVWEDETNEELN